MIQMTCPFCKREFPYDNGKIDRICPAKHSSYGEIIIVHLRNFRIRILIQFLHNTKRLIRADLKALGTVVLELREII